MEAQRRVERKIAVCVGAMAVLAMGVFFCGSGSGRGSCGSGAQLVWCALGRWLWQCLAWRRFCGSVTVDRGVLGAVNGDVALGNGSMERLGWVEMYCVGGVYASGDEYDRSD